MNFVILFLFGPNHVVNCYYIICLIINHLENKNQRKCFQTFSVSMTIDFLYL